MMHAGHATQGPPRRSSPPPIAHAAYPAEPHTHRPSAGQWNDPRALTHRMAHAPTPTRVSSSSSLFGSSGAPVSSPPAKSHGHMGMTAKISPGAHGASLMASPGPSMVVPLYAMPQGQPAPEEVATARVMSQQRASTTPSWRPEAQQRLSVPASSQRSASRSMGGCHSPEPVVQREVMLPRSSMPPPSCSSTGPSSPKSFAWNASWLPEASEPHHFGHDQCVAHAEPFHEAIPARSEAQQHELREALEAAQRATEANYKLTSQLEEANSRLEEAEQEAGFLRARLVDERSKAERTEHEISLLKVTLSDEKGKAALAAEKTRSSVHQHAPYADCGDTTSRLEDQLGSLQVRYNTLKKQYDAKGMQTSELQKQLDAKSKEMHEARLGKDEKDGKLQEALKENKNIRQKMINFSKDSSIADSEHRRLASAGRLMTPGEFARMMKSSEARNNFSQENARLFHRSADLETEAALQSKVLSGLRTRGLGNVIDEVWHDVSTIDACEDPA